MIKFFTKVFFGLAFIFLVQSAIAKSDAILDSCIFHAIEASILHDYSRADSLIDAVIDARPDHPAGYFFKAAILQSKMMDYENYNQNPSFKQFLQKAIDVADEAIKNNNDYGEELDILFFKASALGYLAFQLGKEKHYLKAIEQGIASLRLLNKIVNQNPHFYDAYLGIGTFKFWRSQLTRLINWLPLVPDEREKGIQMVELAIEKGKYSKYAAMNEIVWMLIEFKKPEQALAWAQKGLRRFPGSRFFLWGAAKSSFSAQKYHLAKDYFLQILNSMTDDKLDSDYNFFICHLNLVRCALHLNDFAEAKKEISLLEQMNLSNNSRKRLKNQLKELQKIKEQLEKDQNSSRE